MNIPLDHQRRSMPEDLLKHLRTAAVLEERRCAAVAEPMGVDVLYPRLPPVDSKAELQRVFRQWPSVVRQPQGSSVCRTRASNADRCGGSNTMPQDTNRAG